MQRGNRFRMKKHRLKNLIRCIWIFSCFLGVGVWTIYLWGTEKLVSWNTLIFGVISACLIIMEVCLSRYIGQWVVGLKRDAHDVILILVNDRKVSVACNAIKMESISGGWLLITPEGKFRCYLMYLDESAKNVLKSLTDS